MEISLQKIAEIVSGEVKGDPNKIICGAAPFENAGSNDITCAGTPKFLKKIHETKAGAVIVRGPLSEVGGQLSVVSRQSSDTPNNEQRTTDNGQRTNYLFVDNPQVAFAKVLSLFYPLPKPESVIRPNACIGKNLVHGEDVSIGPFVVIGADVTLGDRVTLQPNTVIGDHVIIGSDVRIYPNVTILDHCRIGNRVTIHAGTVIGSDGFGFAPDGERYHKIPQTGIVQIDDDVEIGAGNTIDRASFGKTWIKSGVKTDNLVHIAHNVTIGENSVIVAQVGIAGSSTVGKHAVLAGQAGIAGHLTIGDNVTVGPQAGIVRSIPSGETVSGTTTEMPHRVWLRVQRIIPKLPELKKKIRDLEEKVNALMR